VVEEEEGRCRVAEVARCGRPLAEVEEVHTRTVEADMLRVPQALQGLVGATHLIGVAGQDRWSELIFQILLVSTFEDVPQSLFPQRLLILPSEPKTAGERPWLCRPT